MIRRPKSSRKRKTVQISRDHCGATPRNRRETGRTVNSRYLFPLCILLAAIFVDACRRPASEGGNVWTRTSGEVTIFPPVLYPGPNRLVLTSDHGISSIRIIFPDSLVMAETRTEGGSVPAGCPTSHEIGLHLPPGSSAMAVVLGIETTLCDSVVDVVQIGMNNSWIHDVITFPEGRPGEKVCMGFQVEVNAYAPDDDAVVTGVTSPDSRVSFEFTSPPPIRIPPGTTYRYTVCFSSDTTGTFRIPVVTWMKRDYPYGGFTTYPVADTAVIRVRKSEG